MARKQGILVQWNDQRGFGFIETGDRLRYFVHVSALGRIETRPRQGDVVSFEATSDRYGRRQASDVVIAGANPVKPVRRAARGPAVPTASLSWRLPAAAACAGLLAVAIVSGHAPIWLALVYVGMGAVSFYLYGADKDFAEAGQWRISEAMLLSVDLGFGILGGLLAQDVFRHKTRKRSYVATTILLSAVHAGWMVCLALGWITQAEIVSVLRELGIELPL